MRKSRKNKRPLYLNEAQKTFLVERTSHIERISALWERGIFKDASVGSFKVVGGLLLQKKDS